MKNKFFTFCFINIGSDLYPQNWVKPFILGGLNLIFMLKCTSLLPEPNMYVGMLQIFGLFPTYPASYRI